MAVNNKYFSLSNIIKGIIIISCIYTGLGFMEFNDNVTLVLDNKNISGMPKRYRVVNAESIAALSKNNVNISGLENFHVAASGQFSEETLEKVISEIGSNTVVLDLRQESHGFINGNPVTLHTPRNDINSKKSDSQIKIEEEAFINSLKAKQEATYFIVQKNNDAGYTVEYINPVETKVVRAESEQELVNRHELDYVRFYVEDHHKPSPEQVDGYIEFINSVSSEKNIYVHCRGGSGRTTTFMAVYDILKNAKQYNLSLEDVLIRQEKLGGRPLFSFPDINHWKYQAAVERYEFIKDFYNYVTKSSDINAQSYSDWSALKKS